MNRPVFVPLAVSVLLHVTIVLLLLLHVHFGPEPRVLPPVNIVQAKLVKLNATPIPEAKPAPKPKPAPEPPRPQPVKPEPKPQPAPPKPDPARQKQLQLEQAKAEKAKLELARKKAEQEKQAAERKRQQELAEQQRKQREQAAREDLARAMAQEEQAQQAAADQEAVTSYVALITRAIQNSWSRPPSARRDMQVTLLIQLIPAGDVINVSVVESSGNSAFDLSAVNAVRKAGRFPELQNLPNRVFEQNFRHLKLVFRPEDLRQ